jgi:hypothetical protein
MKFSGEIGHGYSKFYDGTELKKLTTILGEPQGDLIGSNDREEIQTDEGHWYVGDTALQQSITKITGRDEGWAFTPEYRAILLFGLSEYVSPSTDSVVVDLILSLPISDYRRNRPNLTKLLKKTHLVKRPGRRNLLVTIRNLIFLPQGFAPAKKFLALDRTVATLDLGSRNINYATFEGNRLIDNKTDSRESGATEILLDIGKQIEERTHREFTIPQIVEILNTKIARASNRDWDVSDIIDDRLSYYFRYIESVISNIWGNVAAIDNLICFGGGIILAGERLQAKYPDQVVILDNPQFAAVLAQYDYLKHKLG